MVFSSHLFLFYFLPLALLLYYAVPRHAKHLILTLLSYLFYGWANPLFVVLLLGSTVIDYACGLAIAGRAPMWVARLTAGRGPDRDWRALVPLADPNRHTRRQRLALLLSVCTNLWVANYYSARNPLRLSSLVILGVVARMFRCATRSSCWCT